MKKLLKKNIDDKTLEHVDNPFYINKITIELSLNLSETLCDKNSDVIYNFVLTKIKFLEDTFKSQFGIPCPNISFVRNTELEDNSASICIRNEKIYSFTVPSDCFVSFEAKDVKAKEGWIKDEVPFINLSGYWLKENEFLDPENNDFKIHSKVDWIIYQLQYILFTYVAKFISRQDVKNYLDYVFEMCPVLKDEMLDKNVSYLFIQRILQSLLIEYINIKDLSLILEYLFEAVEKTRDYNEVANYIVDKLYKN